MRPKAEHDGILTFCPAKLTSYCVAQCHKWFYILKARAKVNWSIARYATKVIINSEVYVSSCLSEFG